MIVWPWTAWLRARRQVAALREWAPESLSVTSSSPLLPFIKLRNQAKGYFAARDYLGVERCYIAARERIEASL